MAIATNWESEDQIPETLRPLVDSGDIVENDDGAWELQVEGMVSNDRLSAFRQQNIALRKERDKLTKSLRQHGGPKDVENFDTLVSWLEDRFSQTDPTTDPLDDEATVSKVLDSQTTKVVIGDREFRVVRGDSRPLETAFKKLGAEIDDAGSLNGQMRDRLHDVLYENAANAAMRKLEGVKTKAAKDILREIKETFVFDENFELFQPDPDADPPKNGELPAPRQDDEGKNVTPLGYLQEVQESGDRAGVWFEEADGPKPPGGGGGGDQGGNVHGASRVARGLAKLQKG